MSDTRSGLNTSDARSLACRTASRVRVAASDRTSSVATEQSSSMASEPVCAEAFRRIWPRSQRRHLPKTDHSSPSRSAPRPSPRSAALARGPFHSWTTTPPRLERVAGRDSRAAPRRHRTIHARPTAAAYTDEGDSASVVLRHRSLRAACPQHARARARARLAPASSSAATAK